MQRSPETPNIAKQTVGLKDLAFIFGVSESSVMTYAREAGMPKGSQKGRYPLVECIRWQFDRLRSLAEAESKDIVEERRKLIVAQRMGQELENARERGELLEAELVASTIQSMLAAIATQMDGLAPRLAGTLANLDDPAVIQRKLFDECRNIRRSAAGAVKALGDSLAGRLDPDAAAQPKRRAVGRRKPRAAAGEPGAGAVAD